jgi:hypothetical protein
MTNEEKRHPTWKAPDNSCAFWVREPEDKPWRATIRLRTNDHKDKEFFFDHTDQIALENEHLEYKRCRKCGDEFPAITFVKGGVKVHHDHEAHWVFTDGPLCMKCDPPVVVFPIFKWAGMLHWRMHLHATNGELVCFADRSKIDGHVIGTPWLNVLSIRHMDEDDEEKGNEFRFHRSTEKTEPPEGGYPNIMKDQQPSLFDPEELEYTSYKETKLK